MEIIKPHQKKSREVVEGDLDKIRELAPEIAKLCLQPIGLYKGGFAIAHYQVEENDPLRFFVTDKGEVIINPKITRHTNVFVDKKEACLSFADKKTIIVNRWNKCEVEYTTLDDFPEIKKESLSGIRSQVFQHEIDHMNAVNIYDK